LEKRYLMKKKKILIYSPYYNPEPFPINSFVEELSLRDKIDSVTIITSIPNYRNYKFYTGYSLFGPYYEKINNLNIIRLPVVPRFSNSKLAIFCFYISFCISSFIYLLFFSILKRNKFDHMLTFCGSPVYVGYIGYISSKILKVSSSQWVQDIWPEAIESTVGMKNKSIRSIILFMQNYMWNLCDILFSESDALTKYLKKKFLNKKVVTLYNPIRNESQINKKILDNNLTIFSYIGNIGGAQNIEIIVKSFIEAQLPNSKLNMCGDGSLLNDLRSKYNNKNIEWFGWITGSELEKMYEISDFYILSLNSIGRQKLIIPSKVQSYFKNRRPLLCISTGAAKDLVLKTNAGLACSNLKVKDIATVFKLAKKTNQIERNIMADNGYNYYINNFTKTKIVDKFLSSI
tara:strand:- start:9817 stop:11025 length:1209 start_codon:yes stop_codon:yes gene_type:complete